MQLTATEDCQDVVHFVEGLKEGDEVEQFGVVGIVEPRCHRDLGRGRERERER